MTFPILPTATPPSISDYGLIGDMRTAALVMQATLRAVQAARLTTLMVTHNMQQAIDYGNRLVMMDAGRVRLDVGGDDKRGLTVDGLVRRFHLADDKLLLAS